jgi:hypothetical protein
MASQIPTSVSGLASQADDKKSYTKGQGDATFTSASNAPVDANGVPLYGMDKELAEKQAAKFDPAVEKSCREWIETVTGEKMGECTLQEELKSGVVLCNLVNALKPGVCPKPATGKMAFKQMENIGNYLSACEKLGVPAYSSFQTVSLYENKDMIAVLTNIQALGSAAQKLPGYSGPVLGVKLADANKREFTPEQLAEAMNTQTFLGKGSHGHASQAGMTDRSGEIVKTNYIQGLGEGLGQGAESTMLMQGSHGGASQAGMSQNTKEIVRPQGEIGK